MSRLQPLSTELPDEVMQLLKPTSLMAHNHRQQWLSSVAPEMDFGASPYFSEEAVRDTFAGTQFQGENHRRMTPHLQEMFASDREGLMRRIDRECEARTEQYLASARIFDVAVIGSGPHGAAVVANLREKFPKLRTILIEGAERLGGQFRSYGPKPAFMMNSRVRRADRSLPALPRTPASINPLGEFAPLELSDVVQGNYAMNTDMGDVCAINGFLSASSVVVGTTVNSAVGGDLLVSRYGRSYLIRADQVVDATGMKQASTLPIPASPEYLRTADVYSLFANSPDPLEFFNNRKVGVIGGGDSALTCIEALLGCLPVYGRFGVGRKRPARIDWFGAPGNRRTKIDGVCGAVTRMASCKHCHGRQKIKEPFCSQTRRGFTTFSDLALEASTSFLTGYVQRWTS